jgi:hypothetical protein
MRSLSSQAGGRSGMVFALRLRTSGSILMKTAVRPFALAALSLLLLQKGPLLKRASYTRSKSGHIPQMSDFCVKCY